MCLSRVGMVPSQPNYLILSLITYWEVDVVFKETGNLARGGVRLPLRSRLVGGVWVVRVFGVCPNFKPNLLHHTPSPPLRVRVTQGE